MSGRYLNGTCRCSSCEADARMAVDGRVSASAKRSQSTWTPVYRPEAKLQAPTEVHMSWKVRRSLQEEAARNGDRLESGGFIFGRMEPHILGTTTRVKILGFSRTRLDDQRTAGTLKLSRDHIWEALEDPTCIGDWHSHVTPGSLEPSKKDIGAWGGRADQVSWRSGRAPGYIGLIVNAEKGSWVAPGIKLRAFFIPPLRYDVPPSEREPRPIPIREVE